MSVSNPLSSFPILSLPTKFSICLGRSSPRLLLSHDLISGTRKVGLMTEKVIKISALESGDYEENRVSSAFEQEALVDGSSQIRSDPASFSFEATLNSLSKWVVSAVMTAIVLWRHDGKASWAAMGFVLNCYLSIILKRILNHERPVSIKRSDPGMPSSHAQSIFYFVFFISLSVIEWLGMNEVTLIFSALSLAFGSYISWLRVSQKHHTISQVAVGAVLGSCFSLLWIWSWDAYVLNAFNSSFWVQLSVFLGAAIYCFSFLVFLVSR